MWIIKKKVLVRKYELPISQNGVPKFYLKWGVFSCFFSVTFEQLNFRFKCCFTKAAENILLSLDS